MGATEVEYLATKSDIQKIVSMEHLKASLLMKAWGLAPTREARRELEEVVGKINEALENFVLKVGFAVRDRKLNGHRIKGMSNALVKAQSAYIDSLFVHKGLLEQLSNQEATEESKNEERYNTVTAEIEEWYQTHEVLK